MNFHIESTMIKFLDCLRIIALAIFAVYLLCSTIQIKLDDDALFADVQKTLLRSK